MTIKIEIKKVKNLTKSEMELMNKARVREFGKNQVKNWKKDYPLSTDVFFVKDNKQIVSFGLLRQIKINYLGKNYNILGICSIISIKKGKGYGKVLMKSMVDYLKKKGKTGLGFTLKTEFFKKAGLITKENFIKRFRYKNPVTLKVEIDNEGDGIYYEGKDNFIHRVLVTKSIVYIDIPHW